MPEREYFSLRYAIPGYVLILLVIGINHVPLLKVMKLTGLEATFGAFLAFLSLFTGSALGFLVSQFWWWWYHSKGGLLGVPKFKEVIDALADELDLPDEKKNRLKNPQRNQDKIKVIAIYDYVSHSIEKGEKLFGYAERRWDMYILLSSTMWSLGIGFGVGLYCRFFSELFLFQPISSNSVQDLISEVTVLLSIFAGVVLLMFALHNGVQWILSEYSAVASARIRDCGSKQKESVKKHIREMFDP